MQPVPNVQYPGFESDRLVCATFHLGDRMSYRERSLRKNKMTFLHRYKMLTDRLGRTRLASLSIESIHLKSNGKIIIKHEQHLCIPRFLNACDVKSWNHFTFILLSLVRMIETIVVNHTRMPHIKFIKEEFTITENCPQDKTSKQHITSFLKREFAMVNVTIQSPRKSYDEGRKLYRKHTLCKCL